MGPFLGLLAALGCLLGAFWVPLGALLGRSWGALGRSWGRLGAQVDFWSNFGPIWAPTWLPKGAPKVTKMEPQTDQNRRQISTSKKVVFKTDLGAKKGAQGHPKRTKNRSKIMLIFYNFLKRKLSIFVIFGAGGGPENRGAPARPGPGVLLRNNIPVGTQCNSKTPKGAFRQPPKRSFP